jgi:hypothetical protein
MDLSSWIRNPYIYTIGGGKYVISKEEYERIMAARSNSTQKEEGTNEKGDTEGDKGNWN